MNQIKNPLDDIVDQDISNMPMRLSYFEKIGLAGTIILSFGLLIFIIFSLFIDIFIEFNIFSIFIDMLVMITCLSIIYFIISIIRKKIVTEALIDTAFQHGVYTRLQPLVENIAYSQVSTDVMMDRISNIDKKVENILKEKNFYQLEQKELEKTEIEKIKFWEESIALGTSVKFIIKVIFMMILTMFLFIFLVNFNIGRITPYVSMSIFILWWLFITNEYSLWKENGAWIFVSFIIVTVPTSTMILANFINYNILMALLYLFVGLYSLAYYIWAVYTTTGTIPFIALKREKREGEKDKFFGSQQKGMFQELLENIRYRADEAKHRIENTRHRSGINDKEIKDNNEIS